MPTVAQAVAAVSAEVGAVGKNSRGPQKQGGFAYRGIDDVINALHGPLARHGVVIVPNVIDAEQTASGNGWLRTVLTVQYDIHGPEGDQISATVYADGLDNADKGPGKAMSYAYKTMAAQVFCIPTDATVDNEATDYQPPTNSTAVPATAENPAGTVNGLFDMIDRLTDDQREDLLLWMATEQLELNDSTRRADVVRIEAYLRSIVDGEPF